MRKPWSIRVIQTLALLKLTLIALMAGYPAYLVNAESVTEAGRGFLSALDYDEPAEFGDYEWGYFVGTLLPPFVVAGLILLFVQLRRLKLLQLTTALYFLSGLLSEGIPLIPAALFWLSVLRSTKGYLSTKPSEQPIETSTSGETPTSGVPS
jgi:hypothetical protein